MTQTLGARISQVTRAEWNDVLRWAAESGTLAALKGQHLPGMEATLLALHTAQSAPPEATR